MRKNVYQIKNFKNSSVSSLTFKVEVQILNLYKSDQELKMFTIYKKVIKYEIVER